MRKSWCLALFVAALLGCAPSSDPRGDREPLRGELILCGGIAGFLCPDENQSCVDIPDDDCNPEKGGQDCPGMCVVPRECRPCGPGTGVSCADLPLCEGFGGFVCPSPDQVCVDAPRDGCDPFHGDQDCPGVCYVLPPGCGQ
jgi:hypothetical protein